MAETLDRKHPVTLIVILVVTVVAIVGAVIMMGRAEARAKARDITDEQPPVDVDVYTLRRVDVPRLVQVRGFVEGVEEVKLVSEVAGVVMQRAVQDGDSVEAGDVLLRIDETFHQLRVDQAKADLAQVEARLREASSAVEQATAQANSVQATRDNLATDFGRVSKLIEDGNASTLEYDRAETMLRRAEADFSAAQASLNRANDNHEMVTAAKNLAETALSEATTRLERCAVRSPIDGRVNRYFVEEGEYATPAVPLIEVVRSDILKLTVDLTGSQVRLLDQFGAAMFVADADPLTGYPCKLHHVSPKIDPQSRNFPVEFRLDNKDGRLLAGMYGQVTIECGQVENVLSLPRQAVFKNYGVESCLIVDEQDGEHRAKIRRINIRDVPGSLDEIEVVSGLSEGERVIVTRRRELTSGVTIRIGREMAEAPTASESGL